MVNVELVNEHKIGVTKGTDLEKEVEANFKGECTEVGLYLAMARQAQREGLPEVAEVLRRIAFEEAEHAAHFAEMNGIISENLKENIEKMLEGECKANKEKKAAAKKAKELNIDHAHDFFDESSRDEARHAMMLKGLLERYFK
ncbi:MAG TPA: rubrerythrin family protein [Methanothermococcus okinawensis]|uniref:Rubrerythrin n=1 Tax=Methanofervidicoccus abyssi TaxID=2082189 RepID=A0A401HR74_9EURY|nr:ferritin family protein [Methanofervidicoccus abyssi]GBF36661.1 rubrerythrin [Methanofervidicoccus abyssi]HIP15671.1 rubrerythrin family protein [Methanothermococcus okinawensis]HIP34951.1 rubrerythrin family protein [Methanothermococcus okinawensis]